MTVGRTLSDSTRSTSPAYARAIEYLYDRINFEKLPDQPYNQQNFRLSRMERLLVQLGNPQQSCPVIHIAGSKGKGSVAWLLEGILRRSGYRTGLYTSPHLIFLEERFAIDGCPVSQKDLIRAVDTIATAVDEIANLGYGQSTFFEITTAVAWWLFRDYQVQAAIIEVGLGGRLDSTNVCWPSLSIISSISYDHQAQLGETLTEIATEKAGIIKPGVPVISGVVADEPRGVIEQIAKDRGCLLRQAGRDFVTQESSRDFPSAAASTTTVFADGTQIVPNTEEPNMVALSSRFDYRSRVSLLPEGTQRSELNLKLLGTHQIANAGVVLAAIDLLKEQGWHIPESAIREGLEQTQILGRIQIVQQNPLVVVDTAHNEASIDALIRALQKHFSEKKINFVFAASKDKKYAKMLSQLSQVSQNLFLTQFLTNPRAVPIQQLIEAMNELRKPAINHTLSSHFESNDSSSEFESGQPTTPLPRFEAYETSQEAVDAAIDRAKTDELICITGSFFLAAEVLPRWLEIDNSFNA